MRFRLVLTLAMGALCACASSPQPPDWVDYDVLLIAHQEKPEALEVYRKGLEGIIEHNRDQGRPVPPGIHGELGVILMAQSDPAAAIEQFEAEIALYSEAGPLLEPLLDSARNQLERDE